MCSVDGTQTLLFDTVNLNAETTSIPDTLEGRRLSVSSFRQLERDTFLIGMDCILQGCSTYKYLKLCPHLYVTLEICATDVLMYHYMIFKLPICTCDDRRSCRVSILGRLYLP